MIENNSADFLIRHFPAIFLQAFVSQLATDPEAGPKGTSAPPEMTSSTKGSSEPAAIVHPAGKPAAAKRDTADAVATSVAPADPTVAEPEPPTSRAGYGRPQLWPLSYLNVSFETMPEAVHGCCFSSVGTDRVTSLPRSLPIGCSGATLLRSQPPFNGLRAHRAVAIPQSYW